MAERKESLRKIRFIVRPATRKMKIIFVVLVLMCVAALAALGVIRSLIERETQAVLDQAAVLEQENADLSKKTEELGSSDSIRDIARDELDLVEPDMIIIEPKSE